MSATVKVFGCRPMTDGATGSEGRRAKTSKGGNRENGRWVGAAIVLRGHGDLTGTDSEAEWGPHDRLRRLRRLGGTSDPASRARLAQYAKICD
jgi:hypothetical protein